MATHAGVALELGITRPSAGSGGIKMMSPQMEAILIWCQCRVRNYKVIHYFLSSSIKNLSKENQLNAFSLYQHKFNVNKYVQTFAVRKRLRYVQNPNLYSFNENWHPFSCNDEKETRCALNNGLIQGIYYACKISLALVIKTQKSNFMILVCGMLW